MSLSKKIIRKLVLPGALLLKADRFISNRSDFNFCIVNFHGVRSNGSAVINNRHMPVGEFEKMIVYLQKNYNVVPLPEIFAMVQSGKKPAKKTIALTFDDGYENNFTLALPVLKKHKVPATFYIISKGLIQDNFCVWPDVIDLHKTFIKKELEVDGHIFPHPSYYNAELKTEVINYLKTKGPEAENITLRLVKPETLEQYRKQFPELVNLIGSDALKQFAREPLLEIASHTHTHYCLAYVDAETVAEELKRSKEIIEQHINRPVVSIAYPDGSYTPQVNEIAKACGYSNLVAVGYKYNEQNKVPGLRSRFTISNSTTFESNALRLAKEFNVFGF